MKETSDYSRGFSDGFAAARSLSDRKVYDHELGTMIDRLVAEKYGVNIQTIAKRRRALNIAPHRKGAPEKVSPPKSKKHRKEYAFIGQLGKKTDTEIAKRSGITHQRVSQIRAKLGIAAFRKTKPEKTCPGCGKKHTRQHDFCAFLCWRDFNRKNNHKPCAWCGKPFWLVTNLGIVKTCSRECRIELMKRSARRRRGLPDDHIAGQIKKFQGTCAVCGIGFLGRKDQKSCSQKCHQKRMLEGIKRKAIATV